MAPLSTPIFQNVVTHKPDYDSLEIVKSALVTFLVGPQKFPMTIHTGAFENLSIELSAMVNDSITKGSTDRAITLDNVSAEAFQAFTEFAYTGNYSHVKSDPRSTNPLKRNAGEADLDQENNPCKKQLPTSGSKSGDTSGESVTSAEQSQPSTPGSPKTEEQMTSGLNNLVAPSKHFKKLASCLTHRFRSLNYSHPSSGTMPFLPILVELYVFAIEYSIVALRQKTLSSIHSGLCLCYNGIPQATVANFIKIMHSEAQKDETGGKCQLRELCIRFAVGQAGSLHKSRPFEELLRSNGDFAVDFFRVLGE